MPEFSIAVIKFCGSTFMIRAAAILAGGRGSRLESLNLNAPKGLLKLNNVALISPVIDQLISMSIDSISLLCGHKADNYIAWVKINSLNIHADISVIKEESMRGTGGAIFDWVKNCSEKNLMVINGDMVIDLRFLKTHLEEPNSSCKLFVTDPKGDRYGGVTLDENLEFRDFSEKKFGQFTSLGVYIFNREWFIEKVIDFNLHYYDQFSLERDFFSKLEPRAIDVVITDTSFIDIGTVEEFQNNKLTDNLDDLC